jgi:hypothetical protein
MSKESLNAVLGRQGFSRRAIQDYWRLSAKLEHAPRRKPPKLMPNHLARAQRREQQQ